MSSIKILHILWSGRSGGAERFVRDITAYSDKKKFKHIVCFLSKGGWLAEAMAKNGAEVRVLGMKNGFSLVKVLKLLGLIKRCSPDVIHNHGRNYLASILFFLFYRGPKLYFEHGGGLISCSPIKEILFYNLLGRHYDLILANSNYVKSQIVMKTMVPPNRIVTFYIGIDAQNYKRERNDALKQSLDIPINNKVVGIVGRLVEQKGIDDFIKVAVEIQRLKGDSTYNYIIVGEGQLRSSLEELTKKMKIDIKFLGDREDIPELLSIFNCFVFTSKSEAFGIVLLEAMAAGVPIVGFSINGASEVLDKGGAIVLKERDFKEAASAVIDLLESSEKSRLLGDAGKKSVERNYEIKKSIGILEKIYINLSMRV